MSCLPPIDQIASLEGAVGELRSTLAGKEADKRRVAADIDAVHALLTVSDGELRDKRAALLSQQSALSTSVMEAQKGAVQPTSARLFTPLVCGVFTGHVTGACLGFSIQIISISTPLSMSSDS